MSWRGRGLALLAVPLLVATSCDRPGAQAQGTAPITHVGVGTSTINGRVYFRGEPPASQSIPATSCHTGATSIDVAPVNVDDRGRLKDVVVFIKGVEGGTPAASAPIVLDQINCQYVPHVVTLRVGQTLRMKSSDPTLHNVHGLADKNGPFNFGMTKVGEFKDRTFSKPETFTVRCDVHPWMSASVNVFQHSFYAVTGEDGSYSIPNLPAGNYTLVFRHDFLGEQEMAVTAFDSKAATFDAMFEKKAK